MLCKQLTKPAGDNLPRECLAPTKIDPISAATKSDESPHRKKKHPRILTQNTNFSNHWKVFLGFFIEEILLAGFRGKVDRN